MATADARNAVAAVQDALQSAFDTLVADYLRTAKNKAQAREFIERLQAQQEAYYNRIEQAVERASTVQARSTGPLASLSDDALVGILQRKEPNARAAANALVNRYYNEIHRYALYRTGYDEAAADDVTQDTFVRMLESIDDFVVGEYPFIAWLKGKAKFLSLQRIRPLRRAASLTVSTDDGEEQFDIESEEAGPDIVAERADLMERVLAVAQTLLDETEKRILSLHYGEDKSTAEIAEELGIAQGTVKRKLKEARDDIKSDRSVQAMMGREHNPPDEAAFDRLLRQAFHQVSRRERNPSNHAAIERILNRAFGYREHNPPDDTPATFADTPEVALQVGLADLRNAYPHPVDQGYATGYLMHLVKGAPAPRTFALPTSQKMAIESAARSIFARIKQA